jgi:hypothetical protein
MISADVHERSYKFRQDSDFWYLTGFHEPDAALVLGKLPTSKTFCGLTGVPYREDIECERISNDNILWYKRCRLGKMAWS